jgi:signal peptidase I
MDLVTVGIISLLAGTGIAVWDAVTSHQGDIKSENRLHLVQFAYMVMFIAAFGLMLKFISFAGVLLLATVVTGVIYLWDFLWGAKRRPADAHEPMAVDLAKGFFPVILIVFFVRSFIAEPFKIPSGSMIPTLEVGDFILVNKFTYGIRLPVANKKIVEINKPLPGDVMVFRYPEDPSLDYIKRVVGVPGDEIAYLNKRLIINGKAVSSAPDGSFEATEQGLRYQQYDRIQEKLGEHQHAIIVNPDAAPLHLAGVSQFPHKDGCRYNEQGFTCRVPEGHYFMLGDNRDNSKDSRYWGFVPEENIVGKAFFIWANFSDFKRIGSRIK